MPSSTEDKELLRRQVRQKAAGLTLQEKRKSDRRLLNEFLSLPEVKRAAVLLLFWGVGSEPNTSALLEPLWADGKRLLFPKCLPHRGMEARLVSTPGELVPGSFGIPEPIESCPSVGREEVDLILVPAVCYDRFRHRLGQGGGYYDRYLAGFRGKTVGLCRDVLLEDVLPWETHDLPVDIVLTETVRF